MVFYGLSGRRGVPRDAGHRANATTHPKGRKTPPKAGFFCALAALPFFADTPHRRAKRALPTRKIIPVK